jgi:hypothetical protein
MALIGRAVGVAVGDAGGEIVMAQYFFLLLTGQTKSKHRRGAEARGRTTAEDDRCKRRSRASRMEDTRGEGHIMCVCVCVSGTGGTGTGTGTGRLVL